MLTNKSVVVNIQLLQLSFKTTGNLLIKKQWTVHEQNHWKQKLKQFQGVSQTGTEQFLNVITVNLKQTKNNIEKTLTT